MTGYLRPTLRLLCEATVLRYAEPGVRTRAGMTAAAARLTGLSRQVRACLTESTAGTGAAPVPRLVWDLDQLAALYTTCLEDPPQVLASALALRPGFTGDVTELVDAVRAAHLRQ